MRDGEVPIEILSRREDQQAEIDEEGAALGEKVLIPGELLESEAGAVGGVGEYAGDENYAGGSPGGDGDVEAPVAADAGERETGIPVIVREQQQGGQHQCVFLAGYRGAE